MKKKNNNKSFFDNLLDRYKYVPGFKALIKLFLYIIFFVVIISVVALNPTPATTTSSKKTTTTEAVKTLTYGEVLDDFINSNTHEVYTIKINEVNYVIDLNRTDTITGTLDTIEGTTKFIIKEDNNIYETKLENETINNDLLKDINKDYLDKNNISNILKNNKYVKMLEDNNIIYNYTIENIKYSVTVKDNWLSKIEITEDNKIYSIEYSKV